METHRVQWQELRRLCQRLMTREGMSEADALVCADNLVDADLAGVESHGVSRMTNYMKRLRTRVVDPIGKPETVRESAAGIYVDGKNAMGMVVGDYAMRKCIEKARESGCCFAAAHHSNHFGMAAYYTMMAAREGMIGFCATNAPPNLAPWGSAEKYMGTNPFSISAPTKEEPITLDMAPSVVAMGKIILAAKLGQKIPEGWVVDRQGNPCTDPEIGQYGTLLPIGGPKGSGIAIFTEILCGILAGAACGPHISHFWKDFENPQNVGHVFWAVDIDRFCGLEYFLAEIEKTLGEMKSLDKTPGTQEVFMPGEIENRRRARRKAEGIEMPEGVYEELRTLAAQYGVPFEI